MTLRIDALRLVNFRSYARAHIEFDGRAVALAGPNGAGKTNILEALSMFSPGRGLRRADAGLLARAEPGIGWKLSCQITLNGQRHQLETAAHAGEARSVRIDEKAATQTGLARLLRILWLVPNMDRLWVDSASERRKFFDRIVLSFQPDHGGHVVAYEKAMRQRNRLLKDRVDDRHWYDALEAQMAETGEKIMQSRALALDMLNAAMAVRDGRFFPVAELTLQYEQSISARGLRDIFAENRPRDFRAGTTGLGPHRVELEAEYTAKKQPARLCSTGEQKAMLVSLILANARALLETDAAPILLLDEVAAHLDAERRAALYNEVEALGIHSFMTGTEPHLFEALGARGQIYRVCESASGSQIVAENFDA